jgi:hypothetical protein
MLEGELGALGVAEPRKALEEAGRELRNRQDEFAEAAEEEESGEGGEERAASFELLLGIAEKRILELFRDEEGEVHAVIRAGPDPPHEEVWPVGSRRFDSLLNVWFYEEFGRGVRQEVRRDVADTLQARGLGAPSKTLSFFCSLEENPEPKITVDLLAPDWSGVWIQPAGIMGAPLPPAFRRFEHLAPLWEPEIPFQGEPGMVILDFLYRIIPAPEDPRAYDLLAPILPVLFLPIPRPILAFLGGHGSGKSFAQRMIARVYMPGGPVAAWGDAKDLAVVARQNPLLLYDNLGEISDWLARFLCVCVTGERIGTRELYSDKEGTYYGFRRALLVNGIAPNIYEYPDLMDRTIVVKLRRIPEEKKRTEAELEREAGALLPKVFSACLEALRRALAELPRAKEDLRGRLPRMADFAEWGEAAARGMGYPPMSWFGLYMEWIGETVAETVESSPLGRALLKLAEELRADAEALPAATMEELEERLSGKGGEAVKPVRCLLGGRPSWVGTPSNLLGDLRAVMGEEAEEEGFPRTPQILGTKLRGLASSLQDLGVEVSFRRVGKKSTRVVVIQTKRGEGSKLADNPDKADNKFFTVTPQIPSVCVRGKEEGAHTQEGEGVTNIAALSALSACQLENARDTRGDVWSRGQEEATEGTDEGEREEESVTSVTEERPPLAPEGGKKSTQGKEEGTQGPGVEYTEILLLGDMEYVVVGEDGKTYGPFRRGERVRVPKGLAGVLVARGVAAEVKT